MYVCKKTALFTTIYDNAETEEESIRKTEEEDFCLEETMIHNIGAMLLRSRDVKKATAFFIVQINMSNNKLITKKNKKNNLFSIFYRSIML